MIRNAHPHELHMLVSIDDQASQLYAQAGLQLALEPDHPFVQAEVARWSLALEQQHVHVAIDDNNTPIGFIVLGYVDRQPYLDQIAVHPQHMRQGIGSKLLDVALCWSGRRRLWLTTYAHLPWNKPYYERHGFITVPPSECGSELCAIVQNQRSALPAPNQRIAMVHNPQAPGI